MTQSNPLHARTLRKPIEVRDGFDYQEHTTSPIADLLGEVGSALGRPETGPLEELSQWFDERRAEAHPHTVTNRHRTARAKRELRAMDARVNAADLAARVVRCAQEGRVARIAADDRAAAAQLIELLAQALGGAL